MITLNVKKKKTKDGERWEQEVLPHTPEGGKAAPACDRWERTQRCTHMWRGGILP